MEWEVYSSGYQLLSMLSLDPCLESQSEGIVVRHNAVPKHYWKYSNRSLSLC